MEYHTRDTRFSAPKEGSENDSTYLNGHFSEAKQRLLISLVNFQKQLPNIPVDDICVRVRLEGRAVKRLLLLPHERDWECEMEGNLVVFRAPRLETLLMFALDYAT